MKLSGSISKLGLFLAVSMLAAGGYLTAFPADMVASHPNMMPRGNTPSRFVTPTQHVTPAQSRFHGIALMVFGLVVGAVSLYRPKE